MNSNGHIDVEDLALFALLLLSDEDAGAVRAHLLTCAQCREELGHVRKDLATYALAVEPVELQEESRARFATRLGGREHGASAGSEAAADAATDGGAPERTEWRGALPIRVRAQTAAAAKRRGAAGRALAWVGWAAAAAALPALLHFRQDRDRLQAAMPAEQSRAAAAEAEAQSARRVLHMLSDPASVRVNLTVPKAPAVPAARATYEARSGTLLLFANNLAPLASQKVYELWLIPADGGSPVAAGTFSPDAHGNVSLLLPTLHGAVAAKAFGITVEPTGGSPTPTMPILLAGAPT